MPIRLKMAAMRRRLAVVFVLPVVDRYMKGRIRIPLRSWTLSIFGCCRLYLQMPVLRNVTYLRQMDLEMREMVQEMNDRQDLCLGLRLIKDTLNSSLLQRSADVGSLLFAKSWAEVRVA